jgi:hypothetical protein
MTRLAKSAIVLALLAMILPTAAREFGRMFASSLPRGTASGSLLVNSIAVLLCVFFCIGLLVRLGRLAQTRDGATVAQRQQRARREHVAARRPAEDLPDDRESAAPEDNDDPELPWDGE